MQDAAPSVPESAQHRDGPAAAGETLPIPCGLSLSSAAVFAAAPHKGTSLWQNDSRSARKGGVSHNRVRLRFSAPPHQEGRALWMADTPDRWRPGAGGRAGARRAAGGGCSIAYAANMDGPPTKWPESPRILAESGRSGGARRAPGPAARAAGRGREVRAAACRRRRRLLSTLLAPAALLPLRPAPVDSRAPARHRATILRLRSLAVPRLRARETHCLSLHFRCHYPNDRCLWLRCCSTKVGALRREAAAEKRCRLSLFFHCLSAAFHCPLTAFGRVTAAG